MQPYFPDGSVTSQAYTGDAKIPLAPQTIYSRKKGQESEAVATYDAEFRAGFDRKITDWACDVMTRCKEEDKPFYAYLPYTQVHIPPTPNSRARPRGGTSPTCSCRWTPSLARSWTSWTS